MTLRTIVMVMIAVVAIIAYWTSPLLTISDVQAANVTNRSNIHRIQAGGGDYTAPLTVFLPQNIEIKAGESVTWDNPSRVAEPHSATFVLDNKTMTDIVSPFAVPDSTQLCYTSEL
jgi:plastocyanin